MILFLICFYCLVAKSCLTFCDPMDCSMPGSPSSTPSWNLLRVMSIESVMLFNLIILWSCSPPALNFPSIRVFSNESALWITWSRYWNFSFRNNSSNEYSGLVAFRIDWFDLFAVQGPLRVIYSTTV